MHEAQGGTGYLGVLLSRLLGPADPQVEPRCHHPRELQVLLKRKAHVSGLGAHVSGLGSQGWGSRLGARGSGLGAAGYSRALGRPGCRDVILRHSQAHSARATSVREPPRPALRPQLRRRTPQGPALRREARGRTFRLEATSARPWPSSSFSKRWRLLATPTGATKNSARDEPGDLTDSDLWEERTQTADRAGEALGPRRPGRSGPPAPPQSPAHLDSRVVSLQLLPQLGRASREPHAGAAGRRTEDRAAETPASARPEPYPPGLRPRRTRPPSPNRTTVTRTGTPGDLSSPPQRRLPSPPWSGHFNLLSPGPRPPQHRLPPQALPTLPPGHSGPRQAHPVLPAQGSRPQGRDQTPRQGTGSRGLVPASPPDTSVPTAATPFSTCSRPVSQTPHAFHTCAFTCALPSISSPNWKSIASAPAGWAFCSHFGATFLSLHLPAGLGRG